MLRLCLLRGARLAGASSPAASAAPAPSALPLALATAAAWMPAALARLRPPSVGHIAQTALLPLLLMVGKSKHAGKSKRLVKPANHGARPCNHRGRRARRPRRSHYKG